MIQICRICSKEIIPGEHARYSVADSDDGLTGEHWECHEEQRKKFDDTFKTLPDKIKEFEKSLADLRKILKQVLYFR